MDESRANLGPAETEIYEVSEAWSQAIVANDAERMGRFMAEDWIMVSNRGVSTREHFLSVVASGELTHDSMELAEFSQLKVYGNTALLVGRVTNIAHFDGHTYNANEWTSDVFVRSPAGWKCVMTHITPVQEIGSTADSKV